MRSIGQQFLGDKNIPRVWDSIAGAVDNHHKSMLQAEHIVSFNKCTVTASRGQQIAGDLEVNYPLSPTYEIRDIDVNVNLE